MAQVDTVDRILDAAEALFAERGFSETSVRTITSAAGVNLAAVNYHFGSKKALIQAVFARYLTPLCQGLERATQELANKSAQLPAVDDILQCLFQTALRELPQVGGSPQRFMQLLGLAYSQAQGHLRHYIVNNYGDYYRQFIALLRDAAPHLDPATFLWRLYFMLGASIFTLSSYDSIQGILREDYQLDSSLEGAIELLVPSLSGLISASR